MIGIYTGKRGELNFEDDLVSMLVQAGWSSNILVSPTLNELESNLRQIINENNIDKLGTSTLLTDGEFGQIINKIKSDCTSPIAANVFINGKRVAIKSEIARPRYAIQDDIYLDIFDPVEVAGGKSRYQIARQPKFKTSSKFNDRRGDVMLLINGLPVIHIELKASGHDVEEGIAQIQKYMYEGVFSDLFSLIQVFFVMTPEDCIYFANPFPTINRAFVFHWGDNENEPVHNWQELIHGKNQILSIPEAHQLVGYYTCASIPKDSRGCIEKIDAGTLMVARSYQVHAIQAILHRVKIQRWGNHTPRGGYVWGTTGCGKTFTSYKVGQLIIDKNYVDKVVFVVDRVELSDQSFAEYNAFARDGEPIVKSRNTKELFQLLQNGSDRMIITSIQKLSRINEEKSKYINQNDIEKINKKRVVFIIDEAHRSQFGEMHKRIKKTFVNALFIGFTGTPIFSENDKTDGVTSETVFGPCLAVYSISSGIKDKNVLGFYPKMVRTFDDADLRNAVACDKAKVRSRAEAEEDTSRRKIYDKYYNLPMVEIEALLPSGQYNCDEHRQAVVKDIMKSWDILSNVGGSIRFHAILATSSIEEAVEYYILFKNTKLKVTTVFDTSVYGDTQRIIWKEKALVEIIDDYNSMFNTGNIINREADPKLTSFKRDVISRLSHKGAYKNITEEDMIDIVIVVDQLLTGFDSKYVNTLYLDKVLETDALIQAISRTNRVLDFDEKPWGIFKYYRKPYTMKQNIVEALRLYCEGGATSGAIVNDIDENLTFANLLYADIKQIFDRDGIKDFIKVPASDVDCQKFKERFKLLTQTLNGMRLQGMNWTDDNDDYVTKLDVCGKWIDGHTRIFDILYMRYQDVTPTTSQGTPCISLGYKLSASLSEVEQDKIDADYLEAHFKRIIPTLIGNFDELEKELAIGDFSKQLGTLSVEHQKIALIIIDDIRAGKLDVQNKTLKELIAEYKDIQENKDILEFADKYGLDAALLHKIYKTPGNHDIEIGKLGDTCDKKVAEQAFGVNGASWLNVRSKLEKAIRNFIQ